MDSVSKRVGDALFTRTRQRVLALLYGNPHTSYYLNEIVRWADVGRGSVKRVLDDFCAAGLITMTVKGNQTHYEANPSAPVFEDLLNLTRKTFGHADVIESALERLRKKIRIAFIYGSIAKKSETSRSDVDLMIVSDSLGYRDVVSALKRAETELGRPINPTLYNTREFLDRVREDRNFLRQVLSGPRIWIIGNDSAVDEITSGGAQ